MHVQQNIKNCKDSIVILCVGTVWSDIFPHVICKYGLYLVDKQECPQFIRHLCSVDLYLEMVVSSEIQKASPVIKASSSLST